MSSHDFANFASGIQSIAIALTVLVGGLWALFRFFSLRSIKQARLELEVAERSLRERGILDIQLEVSQLFSELGSFIAVKVTITNVGTGMEVINWSSSGVYALRVESIVGDALTFSETSLRGHRGRRMENSSIAPGETTRPALLIPVQEPGIYYVYFSAEASRKETELSLKELSKIGVDTSSGSMTWASDALIRVEETDT